MASLTEAKIVASGEIAIQWEDSPPPPLSGDQQRVVDEVWARAVAQRGRELHDSPILVYRSHHPESGLTTVRGIYWPYRYYYARQSLGDMGLEVDPMGVNGMSFVTEGAQRFMVLGRRSATVTYYPGCFECVPSGGLDRRCARPDGSVDFVAMLLEEFEEELCLPSSRAQVRGAFGFVYDVATRTYDVCCRVEVNGSRAEMVEAVQRSGEYSELAFVAEGEIREIADRLGEELIPTAGAILTMARGS